MAAKKGGLNMGKGLQNLIPGGNRLTKQEKPVEEKSFLKDTKDINTEMKAEKPAEKKEPTENDILEVKISSVIPNIDQPRKEFDDAALTELAESIKNFGIIQPLLVQKKGKYYEIIAGERRWRAAKLAGLKKVPVIVREYTTQQVMEISLIENIQREDLNPIEEAVAYKKLIEESEDFKRKVIISRQNLIAAMSAYKKALDDALQEY